jgi:hypothetical protein
LAAPVPRPQDFEDGRLERFDGLVDEGCVLRQERLLLFDDGKMAVEVAGILEGPAHLVALRKIVQ